MNGVSALVTVTLRFFIRMPQCDALRDLQTEACNFTKVNAPPWVFFTFFKLYKCYQIAQRTTNFSEPQDSYQNGF